MQFRMKKEQFVTNSKKIFQNEPDIACDSAKNQTKMKNELVRVKKELGKNYPLIINGEPVQTKETFNLLNPSEYGIRLNSLVRLI